MKVTFEIPGPPRGKQRPRIVNRGTYSAAYTPEQTVIYENYVRVMYLQQCGHIKLSPPIAASITGVFPIPKSVNKWQRAGMMAGRILHTKKIDCDNLAKIVLDSLNAIAYDDDAGIAELRVRKVYGPEPKVTVTLKEIQVE